MNNRILGVGALSLAAFMFWFGHGLQAPVAYEPLGPAAFPTAVAVIMALCGIRLVLQGGGQAEALLPGTLGRILVVVLVLVGYALAFEPLGFIPATALMALLLGRVFGGSWMKALAAGLAGSVVLFLLFDRVLDVVLPPGILETWL